MASTVVAVFGIQPFRIGGVEAFTRELARQLEIQGSRLVAVFSSEPTAAVAEYLRAPNLVIQSVPELDVSMSASLRPLAALFRRYRPCILHLHFVGFVGMFPWLAALCGVKQIFFTAHGSNPKGFQARRAPAWKRLSGRMINAPISRVFCVSNYTRQTLVAQALLPADRFIVHHNAITPPDLVPAPQLGAAFRSRYRIPPTSDLVTQVSWLTSDKGIPQLLEAARLVLRERPRTHFALVGSGEADIEFRSQAVRLGIGDSVTWTGLLENPFADGVYAATDVFCLASQWQEAFGWVLTEAMAFERPVVATSVGGIPEIVDDGKTGFLISPPDDIERFAERILSLLVHPDLRRQMGVAGRRRVEQQFDLEKHVSRLLRHYGL